MTEAVNTFVKNLYTVTTMSKAATSAGGFVKTLLLPSTVSDPAPFCTFLNYQGNTKTNKRTKRSKEGN